jgi:geranylgeranyl pyrophosphate synthase
MLDSLPHGNLRTRPRALDPGSSRVSLALSRSQAAQLAARMQDALTQFAGPLADSCARIVSSPGRRLRPALTLACALSDDITRSEPNAMTDAMTLAAAVELLHCATLVHDDVIDGASTRRGVATINGREGTPTAIVAGDALIAAAMRLACSVSGAAASITAETLALLCAGQAGEDALRFDFAATPDQVREVAAGKAGSLLRAACLLGASAAGLDAELTHALGRYGTAFGVCLQMVDDILDLASTPELSGKPIGADIAAGVMTGPIVDCLRTWPELAGLLGSPAGSVEHARALRLLRTSGIIDVAIDRARVAAQTAGAELLAVGGAGTRVTEIAGWASRFVEAQLRDKLDPELGYLTPVAGQLSQRTA